MQCTRRRRKSAKSHQHAAGLCQSAAAGNKSYRMTISTPPRSCGLRGHVPSAGGHRRHHTESVRLTGHGRSARVCPQCTQLGPMPTPQASEKKRAQKEGGPPRTPTPTHTHTHNPYPCAPINSLRFGCRLRGHARGGRGTRGAEKAGGRMKKNTKLLFSPTQNTRHGVHPIGGALCVCVMWHAGG